MNDNQPPVQPPAAPVQPPQDQPYQPGVAAPSTYAAPQQKSHKGLIIGLVVGGIALLLLIAGIIVAVVMASGSKKSTTTSTSTPSASKDTPADTTSGTKAAYTAKYTSDLSKVCDGTPIANAAAYTTKSAAIVQAYERAPEKTTWSTMSVGYGKSYYLTEYNDFAKVSVVACVKATTGAETPSIPCTGKSTDPVINYHSAKYAVTFYEAKTAKKISDGTSVDGPATKCPMVASYNTKTMNAFASPDRDQVEAVVDTFVR